MSDNTSRQGGSEEYAIERDFVFVNWLENGDILVRTEYESLLTEAMLRDRILSQFEKACRKFWLGQHMHIRIEVLNIAEEKPR